MASDTVFGLPGVQTYPIVDALQRAGNRVRMVNSRHEQGSAYMAYGYAKASGRPGIFTVVPGPGVLNTGAALCTATAGSAPVMCLTGDVPSDFLGKGRGHLHELPDQLATLRSFIKWAGRAERPQEAPALVDEAAPGGLGHVVHTVARQVDGVAKVRGHRRHHERRLGDLVAGEAAAETAMSGAIRAAATLPGEGWLGRLGDGAPQGPAETFLARVRDQVEARQQGRDDGYSLETGTESPLEGLPQAARQLEGALHGLAGPLTHPQAPAGGAARQSGRRAR